MKEIWEFLKTNEDAFTVIGILLTLAISSISLWFSVKNNKAVHYVNVRYDSFFYDRNGNI